MAKVSYIIRTSPAGTPDSGANVTVETAAGSPVDTLVTDSDGIATYEADGSLGPLVASATDGVRTIYRDGRSMDQMGTWYPYDLPGIIRSIGKGPVDPYADPDVAFSTAMAVTPGTGLQVLVGTGQIILDGHRYRCTASTALAIGANASGSTRIDRIVARFTREGQTEEGKFELVVKAGTTSAPALTNTVATIEFSLAQVTVINGASSFTSGDITDERYSTTLTQSYFPTIPVTRVAGDIWYVSSTGKIARLAKGTDGQLLALASGIPSWVTQAFTVIVQEGDVTIDAAANTLDFTAAPFALTSSPAGEVNIDIAALGIDNARVATGIDAVKIADGSVTNAEFQRLDATSSIQTQLDGKSATTHTHTLTTPPTGFATKTYASTNVTSTASDGAEISGFDIDIPTGGAVVSAHGAAHLNAPPSPGTYIEVGVKIGSQATDWGMRTETEGGERTCFASSTRTYGSGASAQRISLRARVDNGTGSANAAHVWMDGMTTRVPAS
jgi:hypothetical protein